MMSSAPAGKPAANIHSFYQNRQIQWGDQVMIMIEPNGPGGFYGEIGRTWCLGEAPRELLRLWDIAVEAQKLIAGLTKPGVRPGDLLNAINEFLVGKGLPPENGLCAPARATTWSNVPLTARRRTCCCKRTWWWPYTRPWHRNRVCVVLRRLPDHRAGRRAYAQDPTRDIRHQLLMCHPPSEVRRTEYF